MRLLPSQSLSLALHAGIIGLLLLLGSRTVLPPVPRALERPVPLYFKPPPRAALAQPRRSGGANADPAPPRRGTPPPPSYRTFVLPHPQPDPKLPLVAGLELEAPALPAPPGIGDPLSQLGGASLGMGGRAGIGIGGCCRGIGSDQGAASLSGQGYIGTVVPAKLLYKIEPEFSEEARKARFQGTVLLWIEIDPAGHTANIRLISGPGLGLEQKAIEAVRQWRFRPAYHNGQPVVTTARIEVGFHLF